ncbi:Hsp20/alpha crystallin family protein [Polaromonas jejuensis]|uniref:Hsp20/alpha crystallin family protein n=1 Tax=Polaromonas jejuensis TaxID=457502 RepID=A0ABW0Q4L2_9BURK|nr:Hsp20/alpha crystallin family protein [Polaromonas jejuensis]
MNGTLDLYGELFGELNRLQQSFEQAFRPGSSLRALSRRSFPAINVGSTAGAIEVLALVPGLDPAELQITIDKGLLVIAGERKDDAPAGGDNTAVYAQERFKGSFRRVISLPEDADPARIEASCRDGVLRVTVARREASRPRQISVN